MELGAFDALQPSHGTVAAHDILRYMQEMAALAAAPLPQERARAIWEQVMGDDGAADAEQFSALNAILLNDLRQHPPLEFLANASCVIPRIAEPCLEPLRPQAERDPDGMGLPIGGDINEPKLNPEPVLIKVIEHVWTPTRAASRLQPRTTAQPQAEKPAPDEAAPKPSWQAAEDILSRGNESASFDGVRRQLYRVAVEGVRPPIFVWEAADAVADPKTGRERWPYQPITSDGVAISREMNLQTFTAEEFSDPNTRLLDIRCEYGPVVASSCCARGFVGGLCPHWRPTAMRLWRACIGECAVLVSGLLSAGDSSSSAAMVVIILCALVVIAELVVWVMAVGFVGFVRTPMLRWQGYATVGLIVSLCFELLDHSLSPEEPVLSGVAIAAHLLRSYRLAGLLRWFGPRRGERAFFSSTRVVSSVCARCSQQLASIVVVLVLFVYFGAAAFPRPHEASDSSGSELPSGSELAGSATLATQITWDATILLGGEQRLDSAWVIFLLWTRTVLFGSGCVSPALAPSSWPANHCANCPQAGAHRGLLEGGGEPIQVCGCPIRRGQQACDGIAR